MKKKKKKILSITKAQLNLVKKINCFMQCGSLLRIPKNCQFLFPPARTYSIYPVTIGLILQHVFSLASGIRGDAGNILRDHLNENLLP